MRAWFEGLQPRERIAVATAGVFVIFAVLYLGLWRPLSNSHAELTESAATWERSLTRLKQIKPQLTRPGNPTGAPGGMSAGQSLVVVVDSSVSQFGLSNSLQRSTPAGANGIRVEFENAAFDELVRWLGNVGSNFGLQVQSANFSANSQGVPGRVNATVTLQR